MFSSGYMDTSRRSQGPANIIDENEPLDSFLRKKAEFYFFKMASRELTDSQMRVQFSKDILTALLTSIPTNKLTQETIEEMEKHIQENMTFLKTLYPPPKSSLISRQIFEGLREFDHTDRIEYDLLANLGFSYEVGSRQSARTQILNQTENLFNNLIKSTDNTLKQFTYLLMNLIPEKLSTESRLAYQKLMKQPWKFDLEGDISKTSLYNKSLVAEKLYFPSIDLFKVIDQWIRNLQQIVMEPAAYINKTQILKMHSKKYANAQIPHHKQAKIFNKFPEVQPVGRSRIISQHPSMTEVRSEVFVPEDEGFFSSFYRKIVNFCNGNSDSTTNVDTMDRSYQYQKFDNNSETYHTYVEPTIENVENYSNYEFKNAGYMLTNYIEALDQLREEARFRKFCDEQLEFLRKSYIQTMRVVEKNKIKQKYTMEEKKVYSFSQNSYYFMEEIILERLIKLVQVFMRLKEKSQSEYQKSMVFQGVELIKFSQQNAISAFIVADEKFLIDVYKALIELTKTRQAKIAKIQNRFGTPSNDAVIVLKIKNNPILCQLRLVLEDQNSGPEHKHKAISQINKYLNDIENYNYGPISYLSLILATQDSRVTYLQSIRKQPLERNARLDQVCHCGKGNISERSSVNTFQKQVKNIITPQGNLMLDCYRNLIPTSFVCGICERVVKKGECVIPVPSCFECGFHICVECSSQGNSEAQKAIYAMLINSVAKIVDPCYYSQVELSDPNKKSYNHIFTKDVQVLSGGRPEVRKEVHYHIVLEGSSFVRYDKNSSSESFWNQVADKINLGNISEYKNSMKQNKFVGILFRPRELLCQKGVPFMFLCFDAESRSYSKLVYKNSSQNAVEHPTSLYQISVHENDVFVPILWIFGETLVMEYITKVLQTNPFCVRKKSHSNAASLDYMRMSRSRIRTHHIMR